MLCFDTFSRSCTIEKIGHIAQQLVWKDTEPVPVDLAKLNHIEDVLVSRTLCEP